MDEYLVAQFRQELRKLSIPRLKEAYRNLIEHKPTGISILEKHPDGALNAVSAALRERGQVPPGELRHLPMVQARDECEKIAYKLLENPGFGFNTDRIKALTGLRYWTEVYHVLDVLQDKEFIAKARASYPTPLLKYSPTGKIAIRNIEEIERVMKFTWDMAAVPQTDRGGDGDFGVPIWFSQAGEDWVRWREVVAGGKVVTVSVSPIKGLKRSVLESAFDPSQAQIVNFLPDQDLPYAGAAKGKLWFMATINAKAVKVTITSIRGLTERQLDDAFNGAMARMTMGAPAAREPAQELLPESIRKRLPPLGATEKVKDPIVQVKFFAPWSNWTWYGIEFEEDTFYGWIVGFEKELGYFSLSEMQTVRGPMGLNIERDIHFEPKPLSQVMKGHGEALPMTIPKSTTHRVFRVSDGKLMFASNKKDALREFKRLGGCKAGYRLIYTMSDTMPRCYYE